MKQIKDFIEEGGRDHGMNEAAAGVVNETRLTKLSNQAIRISGEGWY